MSLSKYSKRRGQFEALEAKQLFAADLVGGAAADLPDTPVVAGFDHGDLVAELDPGDLYSVETHSTTEELFGSVNFLKNANLGGQEGEPVTDHIASDHVWEAGGHPTDGPLYLGGQEGEPFIDNCVPNSFIRPPRSNELELASSLGGQEGEPLMNTNLSDHLVVDGEGLYQQNELELASSLGGQEGEPVVDPVSDMVFENLGGQDALIVILEPDHQAVAPF